MNCKNIWCYTFLETNLQRKFISGEYKERLGTILLSREKTHLKKSHGHVKHIRKIENIKDKLKASDAVLMALIQIRGKFFMEYCFFLCDIDDKIDFQRDESVNLKKQLRELNSSNFTNHPSIRPCCLPECNGMVDKSWCCSKCLRKMCPLCYQVEDAGHICDENNINTVRLLNQNVKSCPGCGTYISKIDGCDQMFCVNCKTSFSWNSGNIITNKLHNPHYFEYMRNKNGIESRNLNCGMLNVDIIPFVMQQKPAIIASRYILKYRHDLINLFNIQLSRNPLRRILKTYVKSLDNVLNPEIIYWQQRTNTDNLDLRISYLMDKIDEERWKRTLLRRHKLNRIAENITHIIESFTIILEERVWKIWELQEGYQWIQIIKVIDEITYMRRYTNHELLKYGRKNKIVIPYISNTFCIHSRKPCGEILPPFFEGEQLNSSDIIADFSVELI
tara:strand:+ start:1737 stop:3077 length:1341 start_codon:yes stop_codon:yes gene_type:complete